MNNDQQQNGQSLNYQTQTQTQTMQQTAQTFGQQTTQTAQFAQTAQTTTTQYNQVAGQAATTTTTQGEQAMQYQQVARQETMQMNPKIGSFNELYDQQGATSARNQQLTTTTNQKGGVGTAILIVILFLALIGLVGYIIYTKGNNDTTDKTSTTTKTAVNLSIDDEKVINSYEGMFIVSLANGEEAAKATVNKFTGLITANAEVIQIDEWGKRRLAYTIDYKTEGYYTLVEFEADPSFIKELNRVYNITEGLMRSIVIAK